MHPHLDAARILLLAAAGFAAGGINAVAGGGSLVSFPALLLAGYPALTANVTNSVALLPGYAGGSVGYRRELRGQRRRVEALGALSIGGAVLGAFLLIAGPASVFQHLVPWLILAACALLVAQPWIARRVARQALRSEREHEAAAAAEAHAPGLAGDAPDGGQTRAAQPSRAVAPSRAATGLRARLGELPPALAAAQVVSAVYGAYFGAGVSVIMLAVLGIFVDDTLQRINALKGLLALVISVVAVLYFIAFGSVAWIPVAIMAPTSYAGGLAGVAVARRLPDRVLRVAVVLFGVAVAVRLLV